MSQPHMDERSIFRRIMAIAVPLFLLGVLLICALLFFSWIDDPDSLPINHIKVHAAQKHITQTEFEQIIAPVVSKGFLKFSVADLKYKLDDMVWVDEAQVVRQWPDVIEVIIREQKAVARWGAGGVLNPDGTVFNPARETIPTDLPMIIGPQDQNQQIFQHYLVLQQWLDTIHETIIAVQVSPRHSWQFKLASNVDVILGRIDHAARIQRFVKSWHSLAKKSKKPIHKVDLRYPNGISVS